MGININHPHGWGGGGSAVIHKQSVMGLWKHCVLLHINDVFVGLNDIACTDLCKGSVLFEL